VRPDRVRLGIVSLLLGTLIGCAQATPVPAGAQVVQVTMTDSSVVLQPDTVRAGDVYLALESPPTGTFAFVARQDSGTATPGPMTDDAIERLRGGENANTILTSFEAGGCSPEQDAAARGKVGYCGNVAKTTVSPGRYAIVGTSPDGDLGPGGYSSMAILTVLP
jgi:hypothetical protein